MKQAERMIDAYLFINRMTYNSGMSRAFRSAAKVFEDVVDSYDGPVRAPSVKELNNLPDDIDDDFDHYFFIKNMTFVEFCNEISREVYKILDADIERDADSAANFDYYEKWCDFVNHFDEKKFSKLFQKYLLTNGKVRKVKEDGRELLEIGSFGNLWRFIADDAFPCLQVNMFTRC